MSLEKRRRIIRSPSYTRMKRFIWVYELATFYMSSWGNHDEWFLNYLAQDARQYSGLKVILDVPQTLQEHWCNIGSLWTYIDGSSYVDEGYGQHMCEIPLVKSCDPQSYMYLYAGFTKEISNADIRGDGDSFFITSDEMLNKSQDRSPEVQAKVEKFLKEGSGDKKPDWWDKFYVDFIRHTPKFKKKFKKRKTE